MLLTDNERRLMISRKSSNERKNDFTYHQQKLNASLNIRHEEDTKTLDYFFVDNKLELWYVHEPSAFIH